MKDDFTHHYKRRAFYHDYRSPAIYHVTLNKSNEAPLFGNLTGDYRIKNGEPGCVRVELSMLGTIIRNTIHSIPIYHPVVELYQYIVMPDHIHVLLRIKEYSPKPLGYYISNLTGAVTREWRAMTGVAYSVFEKGYNDKIIGSTRSLDTVFRYIRDNPRRLAVRCACPEYFRRVNKITIAGHACRAYGNFQLLQCPFKEQVVVHRADSQAVCAANHARWIYTAANGGVLVSPFISPAEKAVRTEADEAGGRFITITNRRMEERYKPAGRDFELCEAGRLLIVSPDSLDIDLTRRTCMAMNSLAAEMCKAV